MGSSEVAWRGRGELRPPELSLLSRAGIGQTRRITRACNALDDSVAEIENQLTPKNRCSKGEGGLIGLHCAHSHALLRVRGEGSKAAALHDGGAHGRLDDGVGPRGA